MPIRDLLLRCAPYGAMGADFAETEALVKKANIKFN